VDLDIIQVNEAPNLLSSLHYAVMKRMIICCIPTPN